MVNVSKLPEWAQKFDKENGGNAIQDNNYLYYPNGACRELIMAGMGGGASTYPPDRDPEICAQRILHYHKLKLEKAVIEFNALRNELRMAVTDPPGNHDPLQTPPVSKLDELRKLQAVVRECQKEVENAEAAVVAAEPEYRKRRREWSERTRVANSAYMAQLNDITI